jgi:enoyl-CoA hydratase/carnithine racemase
MTDTLVYREEDDIGYLTLNSPPKNELDMDFFGQLARFTQEILPTVGVLGIIVHGAGRHFSSGANVAELTSLFTDTKPSGPFLLMENIDTFCAIEDSKIPVVAAIGGSCLGAGLELALACHARVAATRAVFSLPEVSFGLMPGCGGTQRLQQLIGRGRAIEMTLSGRLMLADEATKIGMVDHMVDRRVLLDEARLICGRLSKISKRAYPDMAQ